MNKLFLGLFAIALSLVSCSTEDTDLQQNNVEPMLKSFMISRNNSGSYDITHEVANGVATSYFDTKTQKEIFLSKDINADKNTLTQQYDIENNNLNVLFSDENEMATTLVNIVDLNTNERAGSLELLNTYSFNYDASGTLQLNFEVEEGVAVAFGNDNTNDIYLVEDAAASQTNFSKNYTKVADADLHIDFVQTINRGTEIKHPSISILEE